MKIDFEYTEADKLRRRMVCGVCFNDLKIEANQDGTYILTCLDHGVMTDKTMVSRRQADKVDGDLAAARLELRAEERKNQPRRSEADILSELGFD